MLVLLDLLGMPDPTFYNYFEDTELWYLRLVDIESRLSEAGMLEHYSYSSVAVRTTPNSYFQTQSLTAGIEDDHIPFLRRNVPILHLIPVPFPTTWHEMTDNRDSIDLTTVENLSKMLRIYIVEYLHLNV